MACLHYTSNRVCYRDQAVERLSIQAIQDGIIANSLQILGGSEGLKVLEERDYAISKLVDETILITGKHSGRILRETARILDRNPELVKSLHGH